MNEMNLERAMKAIMAAKRADTEPPGPDDLISFRAGLLAEKDRDTLLEQAAMFPETARALIDVSRFPDVEPTDERQRVDDEDLTHQWRRFQQRLQQEERPLISEAPVARPTPSSIPLWNQLGALLNSPRVAQAAAMALLLVSLGLSWALLRQVPLDNVRPRLNLPIVELAPEGEPGERTATERVRIPTNADGIVLSLALLERRSYSTYEIEIQDSTEEMVWSSTDLRRTSEGLFTLELPSGFLPAGKVRLVLRGIDGDRRDPLAVYNLAIEKAAAP